MSPRLIALLCILIVAVLALVLWKRPQGRPWKAMTVSGLGLVYYPADIMDYIEAIP